MAAPVPPSWKDLGKSSSDLLLKDYPINGTSLEVKTTSFPASFKVAGLRDANSGAITGDLEGKWLDPKNGVAITQAWTTSNILRTQVELENQIARGLKLDLLTALNPAKNQKSALLSAIYKQPAVHTRATVDLFKGPTVTADAVVGKQGGLIGGEAAFDIQTGAITRYAAAVGYSAVDYSLAIHALGNLSAYSASYYHRVNKDTEVAARAVYDLKSTSNNVGLEVGGKVYLDNSSFAKAKVNNAGIVVLGYTQALRPGVKLSVASAIDTQRLNDSAAGSAHKVGLNLTFNS